MASQKTIIIEKIFSARYSDETGVSNPVVTLAEVQSAIEEHNRAAIEKPLSTKNPANFFKDFVRKRESANKNWPLSILELGYTARQVTENNACFEFVRLKPGQLVPFPALAEFGPSPETVTYGIESVSLPLASRRLGRKDEPWLIQVVARLRIVETHFSLASGRSIRQLDLLQLNVKLKGTEIDALYLAQEDTDAGLREVIVTCEAKQEKEDFIPDQIIRQSKAPFRMAEVEQDLVIPIAIKALGDSRLYVIEFQPIHRSEQDEVFSLVKASDSIFEIRPHVPGI